MQRQTPDNSRDITINGTTHKTCSLCGAEGSFLYKGLKDHLFGVPGEWNLRKCSNSKCELLWIDPMPIIEDIPKLYSSYYTHTDASHLPVWLLKIINDVEASIWASAFEYDTTPQMSVLKVLMPVLSRLRSLRERAARMVMWLPASQRGRLLDVGCGSGLFMHDMLNLGWDVIGIEPDHQAAQVAKEKFGLKVYQSSLEEAGFEDCTFDAITMNNVFEHLPYPLRVLAECRRILKFKGRLVLLTPNTASLGHKHFQRDWRGLEPPRHLFLFTPNNIQRAIENTGLYVEHIKTIVQGAGSILARSHELRRFRLFKEYTEENQAIGQQSRPLIRCLLYQLWESMAILLNPQIGEEILVIATKQRNVN